MSPLGKIAEYIVGALVVAGILWGLLYEHDQTVKAKALAQYNQNQLQQIAKDQEKYQQDLKNLQDQADKIVNDAKNLNDKVDQNQSQVNDYLNSKQATTDGSGAVSPVIKNTLRKLNNE